MASHFSDIGVSHWRLALELGPTPAATHDRAQDAGLDVAKGSIAGTLARMWSLVAFIALLLVFASTDDVGSFINPFLVVGGAIFATPHWLSGPSIASPFPKRRMGPNHDVPGPGIPDCVRV